MRMCRSLRESCRISIDIGRCRAGVVHIMFRRLQQLQEMCFDHPPRHKPRLRSVCRGHSPLVEGQHPRMRRSCSAAQQPVLGRKHVGQQTRTHMIFDCRQFHACRLAGNATGACSEITRYAQRRTWKTLRLALTLPHDIPSISARHRIPEVVRSAPLRRESGPWPFYRSIYILRGMDSPLHSYDTHLARESEHALGRR